MKKCAVNPYLPTYEYVPDGEPRVFGDRLYIYGSHDRAGGDDYCQNDYVCWSAPVDDLGEWRYEGVIYRKEQEPLWNGINAKYMYAPDVVQGVDGRYYLYYSMENTEVISVAVCDSPAGKYEFLDHVHDESGYVLGSKEGDWIQFDPAVLVDDDKQVYLYSGFNPFFPFKEYRTYVGAHVTKLKADMVTMAGEPRIILPQHDDTFKGHDFFEASSIRKVGDKYYFVYSSQQCHELCYATSQYPDRDYTFGGTLVSNMDLGYQGNTELLNHGGNNHGGMVCVKGQWYIFYHRPTNQTMYSRQGSAEPIAIREDGSISQAEMSSCGLNGGPLEGEGIYEAGIVCNLFSTTSPKIYTGDNLRELMAAEQNLPYLTQDGGDREEAPGTYIANITDGDCAGFKYFAIENVEAVSVETRGTGAGILKVYTQRMGDAVAEIPVAPNSGWMETQSVCRIASGIYPIYFVFYGTGTLELKSFSLKK